MPASLRCLRPTLIGSLVIFLASSCVAFAGENKATPQQLEFFERKIRPVLAEHCYSCHSADAKKLQAGLRVDYRDGLIQGGDSGESVIPGDPDGSLLIESVRYESYEMPPKGKLPDNIIDDLQRWVQMGAPWPDEEAPESDAKRPGFDLQQRRSEHWVWQPIESPALPSLENAAWPRQPLDHFVLAPLEKANLAPSSDAEPSAVMRRLYFDLTGLPPTPEQTQSFVDDKSPQALQRLVDQLLDSPHFGERWGRHWLDLVRYAESRGHEFDNDSVNAYQYRDYIIRALNADIPYDELVREHIAGDLVGTPRVNPKTGANESVLGTGFWFLGEWVHSPVDILKDESDRFDNMVDVMSKTFLGVTVSCARCHDHKFDAISTADYYSLTGFLQSSDYRQVRFESVQHNGTIADSVAQLDGVYRDQVAELLSGMKPIGRAMSIPEDISPVVAFDYADLPENGFLQNGYLFGKQPRRSGEAYLDTSKDEPSVAFQSDSAAVSDSFWNGLKSTNEKGVHNRSKLAKLPRPGRTLRTPSFELKDGNVVCRVRGSGHVVACVDSHRLVAGPLHGQTIVPVKPGQRWVTLKLERYLGHRLHLEFTPAIDQSLEVSLVTQGASKAQLEQLEQRETARSKTVGEFANSAAEQYGDQLASLAINWGDERERLRGEIRLESRLAMAMMDGSGEDARVFIRGDSSNPGDVETRHFLSAIDGDTPLQIQSGSGRMELAREINDPENPLTSRVIVNRVWHHLMGRGIVPTTDDFGVLGARPTHPELLDHLASWFIRDGRSLKRMIRYIVLSRAYQMSSITDPIAMEQDPKNLLWHHRPPKRLEAEVIRDSLITISGELDPRLFGEPIPIHLTSFMEGRGRPGQSGPRDGAGRRSIYTSVRRNFISPFMLTFDTPVPFSSMGRRNVSNVPAQALILMNDPFVADQASIWADRAMAKHKETRERIEWLYLSAFARLPTDQERNVATRFVANDNEQADSKSVWGDLAHALINTKEFIFLR